MGTKGSNVSNPVDTFTDMNGNTVAYSSVVTGSGTAYTAPAGSLTATGVTAYHGGVAVNPNIIPYGSKLYIVSTDGSFVYGYATAVDTGGDGQHTVASLLDLLVGEALVAELGFFLRVDGGEEVFRGLGGAQLLHEVLVHQHLHLSLIHI